jgi:predicted nucleic-acid-binding Zn-ribbon protein
MLKSIKLVSCFIILAVVISLGAFGLAEDIVDNEQQVFDSIYKPVLIEEIIEVKSIEDAYSFNHNDKHDKRYFFIPSNTKRSFITCPSCNNPSFGPGIVLDEYSDVSITCWTYPSYGNDLFVHWKHYQGEKCINCNYSVFYPDALVGESYTVSCHDSPEWDPPYVVTLGVTPCCGIYDVHECVVPSDLSQNPWFLPCSNGIH